MKVEFKYPADVGRQIIESFAAAKSYPLEKRELNNGMLWKYLFTTEDVS